MDGSYLLGEIEVPLRSPDKLLILSNLLEKSPDRDTVSRRLVLIFGA